MKRLDVVRDGATNYNLARMVSRRQGLPCRADSTCQANFLPDDSRSLLSLSEAAARRNRHELEVHGTVWVTHEYQAEKLTRDGVKRMYFRMGTARGKGRARRRAQVDRTVPAQ